MVTGFTTMPLSNFFTARTWSACSSGVRFAVDDAHAAGLRHGDGEARLGDGVHCGGKDRQIDRDRPRHPRTDIGLARHDLGKSRPQQHVVEGEGFAAKGGFDQTGHANILLCLDERERRAKRRPSPLLELAVVLITRPGRGEAVCSIVQG